MVVRSLIRASAYVDSAALMLVQRDVRQLPGVSDAGLVRGTESNKELLCEAGLLTVDAGAAGPDDLILSVKADSAETADAALTRAVALLTTRRSVAPAAYRPRTVSAAARALDGANLALVSVPGRFAAGAAKDALCRRASHDDLQRQRSARRRDRVEAAGVVARPARHGTGLWDGDDRRGGAWVRQPRATRPDRHRRRSRHRDPGSDLAHPPLRRRDLPCHRHRSARPERIGGRFNHRAGTSRPRGRFRHRRHCAHLEAARPGGSGPGTGHGGRAHQARGGAHHRGRSGRSRRVAHRGDAG